jgi:class 3 adenylate cyclase
MTADYPFSIHHATRVRRSFAFVDLCGFTDFAESHGDDAAVAELTVLRATVRECASDLAVRVDKWLGDGVMLIGVEPEPLVEAVVTVEARFRGRGHLLLRGGLATGEVILLEGADYVGRSVNLAARLCDRAEPGQVLAADEGLALPPSVKAGPAVPMEVAGFAEPVLVVTLTRAAPAERAWPGRGAEARPRSTI